MKCLVQQVFYAQSYEEGLRLGHELIARSGDRYSSAMECLGEHVEQCLTYLRLCQAHWRAIRATKVLERMFGEGRRRTKVIPLFPSENASLRLLYASLITAHKAGKV